MNPFTLISLLTFVIFLLVGVVTFLRNPRGKVNAIFTIFCMLASYVAFTEFGYRQAGDAVTAFNWIKATSFRPLAFAVLIHFVLVFTEQQKLLRNTFTHILVYVPALVVSLLTLFTPLFVTGAAQEWWGWTYVRQHGLVRDLSQLWSFCLTLLSLFLCWRYYVTSEGTRKSQALLVALGLAIAAFVSLINDALLPMLNILTPELTIASCAVGGILVMFAIWKYELFALTPSTAAQEIMSTTSDMIFLINPDNRILTVNNAVSKVMEYDSKELIGKPLELITLNDRLENINLDINAIRMLAEDESTDHEMSITTKSGQLIPVSVAISRVSNKNGVSGFICIARDITERRREQENLRKLYESEKSLRQDLQKEINKRSGFTRILVHELKTPLAAIMSASELMDGEKNEPLATNLIKIIRRSATTLDNRINELFDMAQGEIGILQIKPVLLDPTAILRPVYESMKPIIEGQKQSFLLDLPFSLYQVMADKDRLQQVLFNLIDNASKYNVEGGTITLSATQKDDSLVVSVRDTGRGIALEEQANIFNPYVRLESGRRPIGGLGLGLAICKILVELHKGKIWVESTPNQGCTFTFTLPIARETS